MAATFWFLAVLAVLLWYSTITIYVAARGALDIRHMLRRLDEARRQAPEPEP